MSVCSAEFASDVTDFSGDDVHDWMQKSSGFAESDEEAFISDFSPVLGAHSILTRSPPKEKKSSTACLYISKIVLHWERFVCTSS